MLSTEYIKFAIKNAEDQINKKGRKLPTKPVTIMAQEYPSKLDATDKLDQYGIKTFQ